MVNLLNLKSQRLEAGITGSVLCADLGISRSRLSDLEHGYVQPRAGECERISEAIEKLRRAKGRISAFALEAGWPAVAL